VSHSIPIPDDVLACPSDSFAVGAWAKLRRFGVYMAARYNAPVYLVGSALAKANPRDIDVRVTLSEEHFTARFGVDSHGWTMEGPPQSWIDEIGKFCEDESKRQRFPVDFQVYPARHAIRYIGRPRVVLAAPTGAIDAADALHAVDLAFADSLAAEQVAQ
jgi:hypothetical protein